MAGEPLPLSRLRGLLYTKSKEKQNMSLDLTKVAAQVGALIAGLKDNRAVREQRLRFALDTLSGSAIDLGALKRKKSPTARPPGSWPKSPMG